MERMPTTQIVVDCSKKTHKLVPIWRSFGYDEINWTYTPRGKRALKEIGDLSEEPYFIRCHHTFTSGNGLSTPTRGSTNVCVGIEGSELKLDFTLLDRVLETILANNCKPIVELGFMPDALSSGSKPKPSYDYSGADLWKYPPGDLVQWQQLVHRTVRHCVDKFGSQEVSAWYWEVWNEPDNPGFFSGSVKDYCKLYDFAVAGAVDALREIRIGGPALATSVKFLDKFLKHCSGGKNLATRKRGAQLDFISLHAKGTDWPLKGQPFKMPALRKIMSHLKDYDAVLKKYPEFSKAELLLDECDMAVATNFGVYDFPEFEFNNSQYYPLFVVRMARCLLDFCEERNLPVRLFTTWAFYFEGKRFFEGNRALFTNENIRKPVFNAFALLEQLGSERFVFEIVDVAANQNDLHFPQVDGLAAGTSANSIQVVIWNFDEAGREIGAVEVMLEVRGVDGSFSIRKFLIDEQHSNSYSVWNAFGRPDDPTAGQISEIRQRQGLEQVGESEEVVARSGQIRTSFWLPGQSVMLLKLHRRR